MAIIYRNKILEEDLSVVGSVISSAFQWSANETPKVNVIKNMIDIRLRLAMSWGYSWNISTSQMFEYKFKDFIYKYNQILITSTEASDQGLILKSFANPSDKYSESRNLDKTITTGSTFENDSEVIGSTNSENKTIEELSPVNNKELFNVSSPSSKENYKDNSSSTTATEVNGKRHGNEDEQSNETVTKNKEYFDNYYRAYKAMLNNANIMHLVEGFIKSIVYEMNAIW